MPGRLPAPRAACSTCFNHGLMKGLAFLAAGALLFAIGTSSCPETVSRPRSARLTISDLNGAAQRFPLAGAGLQPGLLGLGGLPPWLVSCPNGRSSWLVSRTNELVIWLAGGLRGAEQRALAGLLCPAGQRPLPRAGLGRRVQDGRADPVASMSLPLVVDEPGRGRCLGFWPSLVEWLTVPAAQAILAAFGLN